MKKALVLAVLGLASAVSTYAQGHVSVWSYNVAPYNQVMWGAGGPGGPVLDPSIQIQIWYGAGVVTDDSALLPGVTFHINPGLTFNGGGFYDPVIQVLPDTGVYTFQLRASGNTVAGAIDEVSSRSVLWQPTGIGPTSNPANIDTATPGLIVVVPEPTSFALIGLGSAALVLLRRRS